MIVTISPACASTPTWRNGRLALTSKTALRPWSGIGGGGAGASVGGGAGVSVGGGAGVSVGLATSRAFAIAVWVAAAAMRRAFAKLSAA